MKSDSLRYVRIAIYTAEIILFFSISQSFSFISGIIGVKPLILIPIFLSITMLEGGNTGMFFGLGVGVLMDLGTLGLFGFWMILLTFLGCIIGFLVDNKINTNIVTFLILSFISIVITLSLRFVIEFFILGYNDALFAFCNIYCKKVCYTFLASALFYLFNRAIYFAIRKDESEF